MSYALPRTETLTRAENIEKIFVGHCDEVFGEDVDEEAVTLTGAVLMNH
jgi:hypothetical protein